MNKSIKFCLVAFALGVSAVSQATLDLSFQSNGTWSAVGANVQATDYTVYSAQYTPNIFSVDHITYQLPSVAGAFTTGTGTLYLNDLSFNTASIDFTFTGQSVRMNSEFPLAFTDATVTFSNGTAWLSGYTGTGHISADLINDPNLGKADFTTVHADLNPVPEPASLAAFAVGGIGLFLRRRK